MDSEFSYLSFSARLPHATAYTQTHTHFFKAHEDVLGNPPNPRDEDEDDREDDEEEDFVPEIDTRSDSSAGSNGSMDDAEET